MGDNYPYLHGRVPNIVASGSIEDPKKRLFFGDAVKLGVGAYVTAAGAAGKGESHGYGAAIPKPNATVSQEGNLFGDPANLTIATGVGLVAAGAAPEIVRGISRREFIHTTGAATAAALALAPTPAAYGIGVANGRAKANERDRNFRDLIEEHKNQIPGIVNPQNRR